MDNIKRNNWTNDEIIEIITVELSKAPDDKYKTLYDEALEDVIEVFAQFNIPLDQSGAMGYIAEERQVVHVGPILSRIPIEHDNPKIEQTERPEKKADKWFWMMTWCKKRGVSAQFGWEDASKAWEEKYGES